METTAKQSTEESQEPRTYTPEEMKEMRLKMKTFYEEELPYLRLQEEYQKLLANIELHKYNQMKMMAQSAYLYQELSNPEEKSQGSKPAQNPEEAEGKKRNLKSRE
jgi:hypothetical protein